MVTLRVGLISLVDFRFSGLVVWHGFLCLFVFWVWLAGWWFCSAIVVISWFGVGLLAEFCFVMFE